MQVSTITVKCWFVPVVPGNSSASILDELHSKILSKEDVDERLMAYTSRITLIMALMSPTLVFGSLILFHHFAGVPLSGLLWAIGTSRPGKLISYKGKIPDNEIGDLIKSREGLIRRLNTYQDSLNEKIEEAKQQLTQGAKMATMGELTATISHDLRNPLTVVLGSAAMIKKEACESTSNKKLMENCDSIIRSGNLIKTMVDWMTDFARMEVGLKEGADLKKVISDALEELGSEILHQSY